MRNRFIAGLTLVSFLSATGLPALAISGNKGNVEATSGQVLVRTEGNTWTALTDAEIKPGAHIRTGGDGQAIVRLGDSRLRVAANSEVRIVAMNDNQSEVALERGRILGRAENNLLVSTAKSQASATTGEFVLETTPSGSELRVLSGNARLHSLSSEDVKVAALGQVSNQESLSTVGDLGSVQSVGDVAMLGEWKTKGKGVRVRTTDESVGGDEDASPDQDIQPPRQPDPPVVNQPPAAPPAPPAPPVAPPAPPAAPPAPVATGINPAWIIGGIALIGGIVALAVSGDDDDEDVFIPGNPGVPSPSLP